MAGLRRAALGIALLLAYHGIALAKTLGVDDRGTINVAVRNVLPDRTVRGMTVTISTAPGWMAILPASTLGPTDIGPGGISDIRIEYAAVTIPVPRREVLRYRVDFASRTWMSAPYECDLISRDNFNTVRTECSHLGTADKFIETFFPDTTPPVTTLEGIFADVDRPGPIFLSPRARISFSANDPLGAEEKSGTVAMIEYAVDPASPTYATLKVYKDILADNKNGGPFFGKEFSLGEGTHTVVYSSRDDSGNREPLRIADVIVDGTRPLADVSVSGKILGDASSQHAISSNDLISVLAVDPSSHGAASGISSLNCSIDGEPIEDCAKPFHLPRGRHGLSVSVFDNASNHFSRWIDLFVDVAIDSRTTLGR